MKNLLLYSLLAVTMLIATALRSAEIIPVWNKTVEGEVQDMDFLKGQNEVLMLVGGVSDGQIQKRNPENGELISFKSLGLSEKISRFALTPDSSKFVLINGSGGTLRNLDEDYTIDKTFFIQRPKDSVLAYFTQIVIDPIRPYAYVTVRAWDLRLNNYAPYNQVIAYNYETGEHIKDLTPYGEYNYTAIAVSPDGKYLATLNDNKTYLKVWDLQSMEQIINEPLFDPISTDRCEAQDIYFSKINPDVIYYSGLFTKSVNGDRLSGIFSFNLITKEKRRFIKNGFYSGNSMIFLENETIILNTSSLRIAVLNLITEKLDWYGFPPKNVSSANVIYNKKENYFLGTDGNELSKFQYSNISSIEITNGNEITLSPNPTDSIIRIAINCENQSLNYKIHNSTGVLIEDKDITPNSNFIEINFSSFLNGVYFLTLNCNNHPKTYKIIKEG